MKKKNKAVNTYNKWHILKMCPLMKDAGQGYFSARSRYSKLISQTVGEAPSKRAGFVNIPSALITPLTSVISRQR